MRRDGDDAGPNLHGDFLCPICEGYGEVGTGVREPDTNAAITRDCGACRGRGVVGRELYEDITSGTRDPDPVPHYSEPMTRLLGLSDLPPF